MSERTNAEAYPLRRQSVCPDDDKAARLVRNAVQWLARVTRSYSAGPDEELRLFFDRDTRRLLTPDIAPDTQLGLYLPGLILQFFEQGSPTPHALDVDGRSSTEVEAWLLAELLHRGFDQSAFHKQLPYEVEGLMSGDEVKYDSHRLSDALDRVTQDLVAVATLLEDAKHIAIRGCDVTPPSGVVYAPAQGSMGLRLPFKSGVVEVMHESDDGEKSHYRLSRFPAGQVSNADISVSKTEGAGARLGRQIAEASKDLASGP